MLNVEKLLELLADVEKYLDQRADCDYAGDKWNSVAIPNEAMILQTRVSQAITSIQLEKEIK